MQGRVRVAVVSVGDEVSGEDCGGREMITLKEFVEWSIPVTLEPWQENFLNLIEKKSTDHNLNISFFRNSMLRRSTARLSVNEEDFDELK